MSTQMSSISKKRFKSKHNVNTNVNTNGKISKPFQCKYCNAMFTTRQSKSRHEKRFCKKKENYRLLEEKNQKLEKENLLLQDKLEDIIIKLTNIEKEQYQLKFKSNNIIKNSKINSDNIIVNNFGSENIDYLTDKVYKRLLNLPLSGVARLIGHIHFDPNHPENHNVRITNKKLKFAEVKKNNKWLLQHKKIVLDDLLESGMIRFDEFKDSNDDELEKLLTKRYNKMVNFYGDKKEKILKELELEVLNGSKKITNNKNIEV